MARPHGMKTGERRRYVPRLRDSRSRSPSAEISVAALLPGVEGPPYPEIETEAVDGPDGRPELRVRVAS